MMNDFDRDNFVWFTTASPEDLSQWYAEANVSDFRYMLSLIQEEITKLKLEEIDQLEATLENYQVEAKNILNKFLFNSKE